VREPTITYGTGKTVIEGYEVRISSPSGIHQHTSTTPIPNDIDIYIPGKPKSSGRYKKYRITIEELEEEEG